MFPQVYGRWKKQNEKGALVLPRCRGHSQRKVFFPPLMSNIAWLLSDPIPCSLTENVERGNWGWVDLVWSPAAPVTLDVLLRTRQMIVLKRVCQNEIQILFHEKKKDILKGRAMVRKNLLLPCMKTLFLSLAYPQSVLVICQLVGHWGNLVLHVGVFLEVLFTGHMCFPPRCYEVCPRFVVSVHPDLCKG